MLTSKFVDLLAKTPKNKCHTKRAITQIVRRDGEAFFSCKIFIRRSWFFPDLLLLQIVGSKLKEGTSLLQLALAVATLVGYHAVGFQVVGHPSCTVVEGQTISRGMPCHRMRIAATQNVATEKKVIVANAQLS